MLPGPPQTTAPQRWRSPWLLLAVVVALAAAALVTIAVRRGREGTRAVGANHGAPTTTITISPSSSAPPSTTAGSTIPAAQRKVFDDLMAQVADVRGLQWKGPLDLRVVTPAELSQRVKAANDRDEQLSLVEAQSEALKLLHLIPADTDLQKTLDDVLSGIVLGFYDPETKQLVVGGTNLDPATKYTIAHEMTHALTDQVFNYGPATEALDKEGKSEQSAAYSALLEGDAVLTQQLWAQKYLSAGDAVAAELGGGGDASVVARTPPYILQSLYFPYDEGLAFVKQLHAGGGYAAVDAAYRRPPTSTEQIIHPDTYLAGQGSPSPTLPDVARASGCTSVYSDAIGEFDMRALLAEKLPQTDAGTAVQGWNGDTFDLLHCGTAVGLVDRWQTDPGTSPATLGTAIDSWAGTWSGSGKAPGSDGRFSGPKGAGRVVTSGDHIDLVLAGDGPTADRLSSAFG